MSSNKNAYQIINPQSLSPVILSCEHASAELPEEASPYLGLGLGAELMRSHNAYDAGTKEIITNCAKKLDCTAILAAYSRLWVDLNRHETAPDIIRKEVNGIEISDNQNLSANDIKHRMDNYYRPFHNICNEQILRLEKAAQKKPLVVSIHAFTRQLEKDNTPRPWNIGLLYNKDQKTAGIFKDFFASKFPPELIGHNQPYDIAKLHIGGAIIHAEKHELPHIMIEICDDKIRSNEDVEKWSTLIYEAIKLANN